MKQMQHRKIIYGTLASLAVLAVIIFFVIRHSDLPELKVVFIDVGQGDAILVQRGQNQVLIDGGASGQRLLEKLGSHIPFWDRKIEIIIATHPDADHIGGLIDVMKVYGVGQIINTKTQSASQLYKKYRETIGEKNIGETVGTAGVNIKIGPDAEMKILAPGADYNENEKDTNSNSIVARLAFGKNSFLFTGDLPDDGESELIKNGADLDSDILKVGHHGSKYSSSEEFLKAVSPADAVISVGANNRYGHPAPEAIERLKNIKANIFRTDEKGDIVYECRIPDSRCRIIVD